MFKKTISLLIVGLLSLTSFAQSVKDSAITSLDLSAQYQRLQVKERNAMLMLGGWAVTNIAVGTIVASTTKDEETRAFYQMNAGWNVVNLVLAGAGYYGSRQKMPANITAWSLNQKNQNIQHSFLFNAGLDITYITAGAFMAGSPETPALSKAQLRGFGNGLMLQGGVLFAFDLAQYFVFKTEDKNIQRIFEKVSINGNGVSMRVAF